MIPEDSLEVFIGIGSNRNILFIDQNTQTTFVRIFI